MALKPEVQQPAPQDGTEDHGRRVVWVLLVMAVAAMLVTAVFDAVASVIWPTAAAMPSWEPRLVAIYWLLAVLLGSGAGVAALLRACKRGQL